MSTYLLKQVAQPTNTLGNSLSIMSQNIQMNFISLHEKQINLNVSHVICHDLKSNVVSKHSDTQDQKLVAISVCVTCCHKAFLECLKFEKLDHLESRAKFSEADPLAKESYIHVAGRKICQTFVGEMFAKKSHHN